MPVRPRTEADDFVTAFARGLAVIAAFESARRPLMLSDVASETGLSKATVRRSLLTLKSLGYVDHDGRFFRLTPRVLTLGFAYLASTPLPHALQPFLEQMSEQVQESSSAAILQGSQIVYIARSTAKRTISFGLTIGSRLPAFCTALGRVLLASLDPEAVLPLLEPRPRLTSATTTDPDELLRIIQKTRQDGYALVDEELEQGHRAAAVPVRNAAGQVVAAINIGATASRMTTGRLETECVPLLQSAANRVRPILLT